MVVEEVEKVNQNKNWLFRFFFKGVKTTRYEFI